MPTFSDAKVQLYFCLQAGEHQTLYEWVASLSADKHIDQVTERRFNGRFTEIITCRLVEEVSLRGRSDALLVNWCEVTITHGKVEAHDGRIWADSPGRGKVGKRGITCNFGHNNQPNSILDIPPAGRYIISGKGW